MARQGKYTTCISQVGKVSKGSEKSEYCRYILGVGFEWEGKTVLDLSRKDRPMRENYQSCGHEP